jgi:hypothetical protein
MRLGWLSGLLTGEMLTNLNAVPAIYGEGFV